jgi:hypothetical protein
MTSNRRSPFATKLPTLVLWLACAGTVQCVQLQDSGGATNQWGVAERVHDKGIDADVAVDAAGNAVAVWVEVQVQRTGIWSSRYTRGGEPAWRAPEQLDLPAAGPVGRPLDHPRVAMDARGNAVAAWAQFFQRDNVYANQATPAGSWGIFSTRLDDDDGDGRLPSDSGPQVSMNADGVAVVVWVQVDSLEQDVWAARATPGTQWEPADRIEVNDSTQASGPQVAVDADGNAIAVWAMVDGGMSHIWFNRYASGEGWGTDASPIESNSAGDAEAPQVGVDAEGNAIAVWSQFDGEKYDIWSNRYTSGVGWDSTPQRIDSENGGDAVDPDIAVLPEGRAFAVWSQFDGNDDDIWSNRYTGTRWGTAQRIEENDEGSAVAPRVAVDSDGTAVAVWRQFGAAGNGVWANSSSRDGNWGNAGPIDTGDGPVGNPRVAMTPNGDAVAVWTVSGAANPGVWSNRLE